MFTASRNVEILAIV